MCFPFCNEIRFISSCNRLPMCKRWNNLQSDKNNIDSCDDLLIFELQSRPNSGNDPFKIRRNPCKNWRFVVTVWATTRSQTYDVINTHSVAVGNLDWSTAENFVRNFELLESEWNLPIPIISALPDFTPRANVAWREDLIFFHVCSAVWLINHI